MPPALAPAVVAADVFTLADHLNVLAVYGSVKDKRANEAKAALEEGFEREVDVVARVRAKIRKSVTMHGKATERDAAVNLFTPGVVAEVLRKLGVTEAKLASVLKSIAKKSVKDSPGRSVGSDLVDKNKELQAVFGQVSRETAAELPKVTVPGAVRAASVYIDPLDLDISGAG